MLVPIRREERSAQANAELDALSPAERVLRFRAMARAILQAHRCGSSHLCNPRLCFLCPAFTDIPHCPRAPHTHTHPRTRAHTHARSAEDLIPASGKIVVFDYDLPVKYAFYGLLENNIKCAPVWDTTRSAWVGMLTVRQCNVVHALVVRMSAVFLTQPSQCWCVACVCVCV